MLSTVWLQRRAFGVAQVDVFSGAAFIWAEAVCHLLRRVHRPYVLTLHGGDLPGFAARWPNRVRRLLLSAIAVTVPSGYMMERMKAYRYDLLLLPNPILLKAYNFKLRERCRPALIWLRAFHSVYNPSVAARTLFHVTQEFADAHLTMIGPDKGDGSLKRVRQVLHELTLVDRVILPGAVSKLQVPAFLDTADIFLNTTTIDNTPISLLEAMACGLCIVSTRVGGIPYLLENERDALLVEPNDSAAMAQGVRRILKEPALARRLSQNAREKAEQFEWSTVLPKWDRLLSSAVATRGE